MLPPNVVIIMFKAHKWLFVILILHTEAHLASSQYVVPHWSSTEVDVKICVAALNTHQAVSTEPCGEIDLYRNDSRKQTSQLWKKRESSILLDFGILHVSDGVGRVPLSLFQVPRPHVVHPVYEIYLQTTGDWEPFGWSTTRVGMGTDENLAIRIPLSMLLIGPTPGV